MYLSSESSTTEPVSNRSSRSWLSYAAELRPRLAEVGEAVVGLVALAVLARHLLDQDEATHREVHDRRGDVEQVRFLVDERAELTGPDALRRLELHRALDSTPQRHRFFLARDVAERLVGRGPDEAPVTSLPQEPNETRDAEREHSHSRRDLPGRGIERGRERELLLEDRHRRGHCSRRDGDDDRQRFERVEAVLREPRRRAIDAAGCARQPALERPREASNPRDVSRCGHRRLHLLDGHTPSGADRVPEELVVILEPVEGAAHRVADRVGVLPGDEDVRVADADASDVALGRDLHVGGRAFGRGGDRDVLDRVHTVVLAVVREARRDVAEDATPLVRPEVVGDDLGDREVAVLLDRERDPVVEDSFARLRGRRADREQCARDEDEGDE